ncbi:hypothetical protein BOX15_Mlig015490g3, partial [Macrostomum lignano]
LNSQAFSIANPAAQTCCRLSTEMSDEQQQHSGGVAFEVSVDDENISPRSGKPHHLEERLEDRNLSPEEIEKRLQEAEERRKKMEEDMLKRVSEHNDKVEKVSKDVEERKKRASESDPPAE